MPTRTHSRQPSSCAWPSTAARAALLALTGALAGLGMPDVQAQTVYRCGNTYGQEPCAAGTSPAKEIDVSDPRTTEQTRAAQATAERDAKAVQTLERSRLAHEREEREAQTARDRAAAQASAVAAQQARAAALAEQRKERSVIVVPRRVPNSATQPQRDGEPKLFKAVSPKPAKTTSATPTRP